VMYDHLAVARGVDIELDAVCTLCQCPFEGWKGVFETLAGGSAMRNDLKHAGRLTYGAERRPMHQSV
jgi:hypothetical protein